VKELESNQGSGQGSRRGLRTKPDFEDFIGFDEATEVLARQVRQSSQATARSSMPGSVCIRSTCKPSGAVRFDWRRK
jgi:hypothetical protein